MTSSRCPKNWCFTHPKTWCGNSIRCMVCYLVKSTNGWGWAPHFWRNTSAEKKHVEQRIGIYHWKSPHGSQMVWNAWYPILGSLGDPELNRSKTKPATCLILLCCNVIYRNHLNRCNSHMTWNQQSFPCNQQILTYHGAPCPRPQGQSWLRRNAATFTVKNLLVLSREWMGIYGNGGMGWLLLVIMDHSLIPC